MDTSKTITVVLWATIAFVLYEAIKSVFSSASTSQAAQQINALPFVSGNPYNITQSGENQITQGALEYGNPLIPSYFASGGEEGIFGFSGGNFGF